MIDIHTHLLPGCDDGSASLDESIEQFKLMIDAGVTDIILTPHYIPEYYDNHYENITSKIMILKSELIKYKIHLNLHRGVEVYLNENSPEIITSEFLYLGNSKYILVETGMNEFPINLNEILYKIVKSGYKPILAHPERYANIIKNPDLAEDFMHRNIYLQVNAGSLLGEYGKRVRNTAWTLLSRGHVHFLASDNHANLHHYSLGIAVREVKDYFNAGYVKLLTVENPGKILLNQNIDMFYSVKQYFIKKSFFANLIKKIIS